MAIERMNNASELLKLDYKIIRGNKTYTRDDLDRAVGFFKKQLVVACDGKTVGKTVFIHTNEFFYIVASLQSAWELGCTVFAADYNPLYGQIPEFKKFHDFIDVVIGHGPGHPQDTTKFFDHRPHVWIEDWDPTVPVETYKNCYPDQPVTSTHKAVTTHTSGTTGFPKLVHFTHYQVITRAKSAKIMINAEPEEICMHVKTLHHGALFLDYALPLLSICLQHHCLHNLLQGELEEYLTAQLTYVKQHNINRIIIPYDWIRNLPNITAIDLNYQVSINTILGPTDKEMQMIFSLFNPKQIINMWGCTELACVFRSCTNAENLENYNPNRFEPINPDVDYEIHDNYLNVKWKDGNQWHKLADIFKQEGSYVFWYGRTQTMLIDNNLIELPKIKSWIEETFNSKEFAVVPDYELNQLYLAHCGPSIPNNISLINEDMAKSLGVHYKFSKMKEFVEYRRLMAGMKISQPILLYMFRNLKEE
jgi:anthranilate/para-aminobenzoate synthase component II